MYGLPGAGKTHTTRYVVQQLADTTVLLLSGQSLHFIGKVTTLARELQPSAVVLEDVDLVAEDRGFGPLDVVTAVHVSRALDDLLESGQAVTRALLGVQDGNAAEYAGTGRSDAGHRGVGWLRPSRAD